MRKVIFIDVDGTLRNDEKEITLRTKQAIKQAIKKNYEIVLCTGRPNFYASKLNEEIKGGRYIIYNNGSGIFDNVEQKVIYENPIDNRTLISLYQMIDLDNIRLIVETHATRYVNKIKYQDSEVLIEESLEELFNKNKVIQVTFSSFDFEKIKNIKTIINKIKGIKIVSQSKDLVDENFVSTCATYLDIVDDNTNKGDAINYLGKILNIPKENRIAIGDDENDISMFANCGYKVAMGNALPSLKEKADYITLDNNHDGVAVYLESLLKDYKGE